MKTGGCARIRLKPDVLVVQRAKHSILYRVGGFGAIRVGKPAQVLLSMLQQGTELSEMQRVLEISHPDDHGIASKLDHFLSRLEAADLLDSSEGMLRFKKRQHRWELVDLNPSAASVALVLAGVPRPLLYSVAGWLTVGSVVGVLTVASSAPQPTFDRVIAAADVWGFAFFVLVIVPLHEFAHAIACRSAGVPVLGAGLLLHGGIIPGPYVDTTSIYEVADRWRRFCVPIAGPFVDLCAAGMTAWGLHLSAPGGPLHGPLASAMILSIVFFILDLNPFVPSDGSRVLEAILDDELARRAALTRRTGALSTKRTIMAYRLACVLYLGLLALLVKKLWWGAR